MKLKINDKIKQLDDSELDLPLYDDGVRVDEVVVKEIILEPTDEHTMGVFPLLRVELPNGEIRTYTHAFFNVDIDSKYIKTI